MWHVDTSSSKVSSRNVTFGGGHDGFEERNQSAVMPMPKRPKSWRAPSWAWACIDTPVIIPHQLDARPDMKDWTIKAVTAKVVEENITMARDGHQYGSLSAGWLLVEAPMFPVVCQRNWDEQTGLMWASTRLGGAKFGSIVFDASSIDDEARLCKPDNHVNLQSTIATRKDGGSAPYFQAWCLQILIRPVNGVVLSSPDPRITEQLAGLVVLPVPGHDEPTTYTRIGVFETELRATKPRASFELIETWRATFECRRIKLI